jgi:hypothetical protein
MLIAQILAMTFVCLTGVLLRSYILNWKISPLNIVLIGAIGFLLTLFYDILVSAAYPLSAGFKPRETIATIIAGLAFSVIHLISNTAVFIILVPMTAQQVFRAVPYFQEINLQEVSQ